MKITFSLTFGICKEKELNRCISAITIPALPEIIRERSNLKRPITKIAKHRRFCIICNTEITDARANKYCSKACRKAGLRKQARKYYRNKKNKQ